MLNLDCPVFGLHWESCSRNEERSVRAAFRGAGALLGSRRLAGASLSGVLRVPQCSCWANQRPRATAAIAAARQLKERLETEFLAKLTAGSLQASGLVWPIGLNARRRTIPAARWHMLTPDFTASEATGGGLRIVEIRVQESRPARTRSSRPSPADEHVPREHASLARLRTELRRWLQREAQSRGMSWQKKHYCSAARTRFGDRVTNNLFNEVWRSADLPEGLRRPGLRRVDDHLAGSSPPA